MAPHCLSPICAGLDRYNQTTREVGASNDLLVIDLAQFLSPDPAYFYDDVHFTNVGARKVAELIHAPLRQWLQRHGAVN